MLRLVNLLLKTHQDFVDAWTAPKIIFPFKLLGNLESFSTAIVSFSIRVPSTTHLIAPETLSMAIQLLTHWLGKMVGICPFATFFVKFGDLFVVIDSFSHRVVVSI